MEVIDAIEELKKKWNQLHQETHELIKEIREHGVDERTVSINNTSANKKLCLLQKLERDLDLLIPQLLCANQINSERDTSVQWKKELKSLQCELKESVIRALSMQRNAAKEERALLLGGGIESTNRRRNLKTKAGLTSATESVTESLRRSRQLMVQEVGRSAATLMAIEESTGVLRKAEREYEGHGSLLSRTRHLLSFMQRQEVADRIIVVVGFFVFCCAVVYVVSKRIGLLKLQRTVTAAFKAATVAPPQNRRKVTDDL